ncbi:MAG: MGMT family protein [Candidatus Omnitrophica bacterium]|nr:MGMT family protein [Candidatus Omnitrophota bacterium]MCF7909662.1 MGMT family protein [Candidatus Omnitrophota bacterium]
MTDFEKKVLKIVFEIPPGEVRSCKWIAEKAGRPRAYRAVANALGKNPYPIFIPCHRVVKSSANSGGYFKGQTVKKKLIKFEKEIKDVIKYKKSKPVQKS